VARRRADSLLKRIQRRYWGQTLARHFNSTTPPASNPIGWGSIEMLEKLPVPDVWNLHWVSWFLDWETMLPWMAERAPIVWTLHDLNPLRGIWHYEPLPNERTPERMSYESRAIEIKRRALSRISKDRLTFLGPSRWMVEECRKSTITEGFPVEHIPYGLDTEVFAPQDPSLLRTMFGIPEDAVVIGFVADNINDPRKGLKPLLEAIQRLKKEIPKIHLVTVGNGGISCEGVAHTSLGPIFNDRLISFFYSTCDLFVCPSLQDNLPNTVLESLSCGTPVVAYNLGGLPDMVENGITGRLAREFGDVGSFYQAIAEIIRDKCILEQIRESARSAALEKYQLAHQANRYISLYQTLSR
jgi:glycosyltransferase involved in cell wall biosynthesis